MTEQLTLFIGFNDPEKGVCFVCGKILVKGQAYQELDKHGKWIGNMCSKACVDHYWKWWKQEYDRLHNEDESSDNKMIWECRYCFKRALYPVQVSEGKCKFCNKTYAILRVYDNPVEHEAQVIEKKFEKKKDECLYFEGKCNNIPPNDDKCRNCEDIKGYYEKHCIEEEERRTEEEKRKDLSYDEMICPKCGGIACANYVDVGVGFTQAELYHCLCGWVEEECPSDDCEKCKSWEYCQGKSRNTSKPNMNCGISDFKNVINEVANTTSKCPICKSTNTYSDGSGDLTPGAPSFNWGGCWDCGSGWDFNTNGEMVNIENEEAN